MPQNAARTFGQRAVKSSWGYLADLAKWPLLLRNGRDGRNRRPLDPGTNSLSGPVRGSRVGDALYRFKIRRTMSNLRIYEVSYATR
jgi:hypothetical protein